MDRRGFLTSILAAAVAPAIVRADSLMKIVPRETTVLARGWSWPLATPARPAFDNPTFTGTVTVNAAEWSLDGRNWHKANGSEIVIPADTLGNGRALYVRSSVAPAVGTMFYAEIAP